MYVDDVGILWDQEGIGIREVYQKLQTMMKKREENLEITGGTLIPQKFYWYLLQYSKNILQDV